MNYELPLGRFLNTSAGSVTVGLLRMQKKYLPSAFSLLTPYCLLFTANS